MRIAPGGTTMTRRVNVEVLMKPHFISIALAILTAFLIAGCFFGLTPESKNEGSEQLTGNEVKTFKISIDDPAPDAEYDETGRYTGRKGFWADSDHDLATDHLPGNKIPLSASFNPRLEAFYQLSTPTAGIVSIGFNKVTGKSETAIGSALTLLEAEKTSYEIPVKSITGWIHLHDEFAIKSDENSGETSGFQAPYSFGFLNPDTADGLYKLVWTDPVDNYDAKTSFYEGHHEKREFILLSLGAIKGNPSGSKSGSLSQRNIVSSDTIEEFNLNLNDFYTQSDDKSAPNPWGGPAADCSVLYDQICAKDLADTMFGEDWTPRCKQRLWEYNASSNARDKQYVNTCLKPCLKKKDWASCKRDCVRDKLTNEYLCGGNQSPDPVDILFVSKAPYLDADNKCQYKTEVISPAEGHSISYCIDYNAANCTSKGSEFCTDSDTTKPDSQKVYNEKLGIFVAYKDMEGNWTGYPKPTDPTKPNDGRTWTGGRLEVKFDGLKDPIVFEIPNPEKVSDKDFVIGKDSYDDNKMIGFTVDGPLFEGTFTFAVTLYDGSITKTFTLPDESPYADRKLDNQFVETDELIPNQFTQSCQKGGQATSKFSFASVANPNSKITGWDQIDVIKPLYSDHYSKWNISWDLSRYKDSNSDDKDEKEKIKNEFKVFDLPVLDLYQIYDSEISKFNIGKGFIDVRTMSPAYLYELMDFDVAIIQGLIGVMSGRLTLGEMSWSDFSKSLFITTDTFSGTKWDKSDDLTSLAFYVDQPMTSGLFTFYGDKGWNLYPIAPGSLENDQPFIWGSFDDTTIKIPLRPYNITPIQYAGSNDSCEYWAMLLDGYNGQAPRDDYAAAMPEGLRAFLMDRFCPNGKDPTNKADCPLGEYALFASKLGDDGAANKKLFTNVQKRKNGKIFTDGFLHMSQQFAREVCSNTFGDSCTQRWIQCYKKADMGINGCYSIQDCLGSCDKEFDCNSTNNPITKYQDGYKKVISDLPDSEDINLDVLLKVHPDYLSQPKGCVNECLSIPEIDKTCDWDQPEAHSVTCYLLTELNTCDKKCAGKTPAECANSVSCAADAKNTNQQIYLFDNCSQVTCQEDPVRKKWEYRGAASNATIHVSTCIEDVPDDTLTDLNNKSVVIQQKKNPLGIGVFAITSDNQYAPLPGGWLPIHYPEQNRYEISLPYGPGMPMKMLPVTLVSSGIQGQMNLAIFQKLESGTLTMYNPYGSCFIPPDDTIEHDWYWLVMYQYNWTGFTADMIGWSLGPVDSVENTIYGTADPHKEILSVTFGDNRGVQNAEQVPVDDQSLCVPEEE